jgi:uncharacterized tellurite resistance protein B-like protein
MLKSLAETLSGLFSGAEEKPAPEGDEMRLAAAALLVHAATIDGAVNEDESRRLAETVSALFELSPEAAHELLIAAERREREAIDLYGFTSKLKARMKEEERLELIDMMWRIAYADGRLDALEDNLVWRAAELLGVSARDRMLMKKRASEGV